MQNSHVDIDLKNLKTTWLFKEGGSEKTSTRSIRNKTAEEFIKSLKEINLLNWKAKYVEPGVCDGTQWSVEIITDGEPSENMATISFQKNGGSSVK